MVLPPSILKANDYIQVNRENWGGRWEIQVEFHGTLLHLHYFMSKIKLTKVIKIFADFQSVLK
jgi:hypothetical protein